MRFPFTLRLSAQAFVVAVTSHSPQSPKGPTPSERKKLASKKSFLQILGPGLVTGASDDDPSGIATYSQVGAQFGLGMLWTMLFSYPLMAAIQEICARIGRVTGSGIANNIRKHYPRPVLYGIVSLLCVANIFNLGADIGAMAAAAQLLLGGAAYFYVLFFGTLSLLLQACIPYSSYVNYLKWMTTALFAYVATAFVVHVPWQDVIRATLLPSISLNSTYFTGLIAVLGTTISPYLFFWQASQEAEEVKVRPTEEPLKRAPWQAFEQLFRIKIDTYVGMGFSNVVAFFIILTTAVTLHVAGVRDVGHQLRPQERCNHSRDGWHSCCSRLASLAQVCWPFRFWPVLPPMALRKHFSGVRPCRARRLERRSSTVFLLGQH